MKNELLQWRNVRPTIKLLAWWLSSELGYPPQPPVWGQPTWPGAGHAASLSGEGKPVTYVFHFYVRAPPSHYLPFSSDLMNISISITLHNRQWWWTILPSLNLFDCKSHIGDWNYSLLDPRRSTTIRYSILMWPSILSEITDSIEGR